MEIALQYSYESLRWITVELTNERNATYDCIREISRASVNTQIEMFGCLQFVVENSDTRRSSDGMKQPFGDGIDLMVCSLETGSRNYHWHGSRYDFNQFTRRVLFVCEFD